uniref:Uncharacterized protein n=1 Tax=Anguilla anguilla TaxID=7936 RepID=A0A0E9TX78_ANGAN
MFITFLGLWGLTFCKYVSKAIPGHYHVLDCNTVFVTLASSHHSD